MFGNPHVGKINVGQQKREGETEKNRTSQKLAYTLALLLLLLLMKMMVMMMKAK
jgi:hypothetical protein